MLDLMYLKKDLKDELIMLLTERNNVAKKGVKSEYLRGAIETVEFHIKMIDSVLEGKEISKKVDELLED